MNAVLMSKGTYKLPLHPMEYLLLLFAFGVKVRPAIGLLILPFTFRSIEFVGEVHAAEDWLTTFFRVK